MEAENLLGGHCMRDCQSRNKMVAGEMVNDWILRGTLEVALQDLLIGHGMRKELKLNLRLGM
jgi:hypothetical protein